MSLGRWTAGQRKSHRSARGPAASAAPLTVPPRVRPTQAKRDASRPAEIDLHVGRQIKLRRLLLGLSQDELARSVGLAQQQLHLHERGTRVTASRLYALARSLSVPIDYFFEGLEPSEGEPGSTEAVPPTSGTVEADDVLRLPKSTHLPQEALALIRAYRRIGDPKDRKAVLELLKSFNSEDT